jgi:hypothetical protein
MIGRNGIANTPGERTMCMIWAPLSTGMSQSISMMSGLTVRMTASPSAASNIDFAPMFKHHACQFARIRILVDDQKTDALD